MSFTFDEINAMLLDNANDKIYKFPHKTILYADSVRAPYTPQDLRSAYKSSPVAPVYGKKTVVLTISIAFPFPASLLQVSLDAFCQLNNIPTATLEVFPVGEGDLFNFYVMICNSMNDLLMEYINAPNNNGTEFSERVFIDDYVVPFIESLTISPSEKIELLHAYEDALIGLFETLLDTQWSHAMNPNAYTRVVQSINMNTLYDGLIYASDPTNFVNNPWGPTDIISMSWGGPDDIQPEIVIIELEKLFNNDKICYLASSGDLQTVVYPSTSVNVLGVGGTSLYYDSTAQTEMSQTTWNNITGGGGGCGPSKYIPKPDFQTGVNALNAYDKRCSPDIAGIADPSTGVNIIFGSSTGNSMKLLMGGTSLSCPLNAGMLSNLIQTSINRGGPTFTTVSNHGDSTPLQNGLYDLYNNTNLQRSPNLNSNLYAYCFYDVTQGTDNGFSAGTGFDIPTGLGSPYWDNISATWFYATLSDICFPVNTPVLTDQGIIAIQNIESGKHTLRNKRIVAITQTVSHDDHLVHFSKHSLGHNYPTEDTRMSKHHKVLYAGKMIPAHHFLTRFKHVSKVKYTKELLFNVLLDEYSSMQINNLTCETLHPKSSAARLYTNAPAAAAAAATTRKFNNLFIKADARDY